MQVCNVIVYKIKSISNQNKMNYMLLLLIKYNFFTVNIHFINKHSMMTNFKNIYIGVKELSFKIIYIVSSFGSTRLKTKLLLL